MNNGAIYGEIENVIQWPKDFDYNRYWSEEETKIKPLMEKAGFTKVSFGDGERDSFGPLTRKIYGVKYDRLYVFVYG
jgi:hypothetical protein